VAETACSARSRRRRPPTFGEGSGGRPSCARNDAGRQNAPSPVTCSQSAKSAVLCTPEAFLSETRVSSTRSTVVFSICASVMVARVAVRTSMLSAKAPKTDWPTASAMRRVTVKGAAAGGSAEGDGDGVVVAVGLPVADEERDEADDNEGKADREADAEGEA